MTAPNRNTLWGRVIVEELAAGGLTTVCVSPGSRSTPLTMAFAEHPAVTCYSHLDERSGAYFAIGRARRTGEPTALVCTSGTAAANYHPAVIESDRGRVPLVILTADRPPELRDSGANQTIDQRDLYGNAVRWNVDLPEPRASERTVRSLRTTVARTLARTTQEPAGPVHLNCPFEKPLEPTEVPGDVPEGFERTLAGTGRDGPFVSVTRGRPTLDEPAVRELLDLLHTAKRPLFVAGPADPRVGTERLRAFADVARTVGAPLFADPLSTLRFGPHVENAPICGGYDAFVDAGLPSPDLVIRVGAAPTSKALRHYLRDSSAHQVLVDPAGGWREATFTANELVRAAPGPLAQTMASAVESDGFDALADPDWLDRVLELERRHWHTTVEALDRSALESNPFEGAILALTVDLAPDPSTIFVSNSMPVRDTDRFACPRAAELTVLANRGASGIDGIVSAALGAGSATDEPLVAVVGDLAFYHDQNGLLAIERCDVDATIVLIDNDGGGIFHALPVESHDPPFTEQFKTPHGLDFATLADLYGFEFERLSPREFESAYRESLETSGTQVLAVEFDAEASHRRRESLAERLRSDES